MACNKPLKGWYSKEGGITFNIKDGYQGIQMEVPCGQCMGCRLSRTASWASRIQHEAQLYDKNAFVTLTYDNEHLPDDYSLNIKHLQKFFKRLRKYVEPEKIRFYACGEYGDIDQVKNPIEKLMYQQKYPGTTLARPHFHAIIFNYWPDDCELLQETNYGNLYKSDRLAKIWKNGYTTIGSCTFESAAYCASYCTKKLNGDKAENHYQGRKPEFGTMSRKPGIASEWYEKYKKQTVNHNTVAVRGREIAPPRYYKDRLKKDFPIKALQNKLDSIGKYLSETDYDRLQTMEKFLVLKQKTFAKNKV